MLPSLASAEWARYENDSFIAYSNAPAADALEVLQELEYIRAAAEQTPAFVIPEGRPRTLVILPENHEGFLKLAPSATMAGFAQPLDGGAAIVMPVSAPGGDAGSVIRHEFAHTLLFNEWFRYPPWFAEGFAEIVSNITVDRRRNAYTVGEMPRRYGKRMKPRIDWNLLISEDFDAHQQSSQELIQAAYAQNWLLAHFLTLSDEPRHVFQLDHYFSLVNSGQRSQAAFVEAYGAAPAELWQTVLEEYAVRPAVVRYEFSPAVLDLGFREDAAPAGEIDGILRYFRDKADALRVDLSEEFPLTRVAGRWDRLKYREQCSEAFELGFDDDGTLRIEAYYSAEDADPVPALFLADRLGPNVYDLVNVTADEYPQVVVASDYQLTIRSASVVCFDRRPVRQACANVLQRCGDRTP
jgi:hypothetical protein